MSTSVGVGEAKRRLSELMSRVVYRGERFVIERRGKPMVALVSAEDLAGLEQEPVASGGLLVALGAWADFDEIDDLMADIYRHRSEAADRFVSLDR